MHQDVCQSTDAVPGFSLIMEPPSISTFCDDVLRVQRVILGTNEARTPTPDVVNQINRGIKLRHIGVVLFIVQYVLTVVVTVYLWAGQESILKQRRRVSLPTVHWHAS